MYNIFSMLFTYGRRLTFRTKSILRAWILSCRHKIPTHLHRWAVLSTCVCVSKYKMQINSGSIRTRTEYIHTSPWRRHSRISDNIHNTNRHRHEHRASAKTKWKESITDVQQNRAHSFRPIIRLRSEREPGPRASQLEPDGPSAYVSCARARLAQSWLIYAQRIIFHWEPAEPEEPENAKYARVNWNKSSIHMYISIHTIQTVRALHSTRMRL